MDVSASFYYDFDIHHSPRQAKRASSKNINKKQRRHQQACTSRNIVQKEKQSCDKLERNYRAIERSQKQDGTSRIYLCKTCKQETTEPCQCNYIQWCGKECEWDHCYESQRLGIRDLLTMPYDVLCDYHTSKYQKYLEAEALI